MLYRIFYKYTYRDRDYTLVVFEKHEIVFFFIQMVRIESIITYHWEYFLINIFDGFSKHTFGWLILSIWIKRWNIVITKARFQCRSWFRCRPQLLFERVSWSREPLSDADDTLLCELSEDVCDIEDYRINLKFSCATENSL